MASSPLEIYEQAYRLQYEENNINKACDVYQQIIHEFPDSNESGYAAIQLQKIHAQDVSRNLGRNKNVLALVALIIAVVALLGVGALGTLIVLNAQRGSAESAKAAALVQTHRLSQGPAGSSSSETASSDTAAMQDGADSSGTDGERKTPSGAKLSNKNSVLKYLDSISTTP